MSELRDIIKDSIAERAAYTTERCRNEINGNVFTAEYEEVTPLDLVTDIGNDLREAAFLYVSDAESAAQIIDGQKLTVWLYGVARSFTVVMRENNPGSSQAKFKLKYNVPRKDK